MYAYDLRANLLDDHAFRTHKRLVQYLLLSKGSSYTPIPKNSPSTLNMMTNFLARQQYKYNTEEALTMWGENREKQMVQTKRKRKREMTVSMGRRKITTALSIRICHNEIK